MATKTLTDRGPNDAALFFERRPGGGVNVEVRVGDTAGGAHLVSVAISTLTAAERTQLQTLLGKLYDQALANLGFA